METFIGQIAIFGFNFAPRGWSFCAGQLLSIAQFNAIFSLVGDFYGCDARTTFGLPDLRGRSPLGATGGAGPGLPQYEMGQKLGAAALVIGSNHLPPHTHTATFTPSGGGDSAAGSLKGLTAGANSGSSGKTPVDGQYIAAGGTVDIFGVPGGFGVEEFELGGLTVSGGGSSGGTVTVDSTGRGDVLEIQSPIQGLNFCFAMEGIFPSRS